MSITPPAFGPAIPPGIIDYRPVTDIAPFTNRSGITYQALLEMLRVYVTTTLTEYVTDETIGLADSWKSNLETLTDAVNTALADQTADNVQKIADAIEAISSAQIQITDPAILAVLNSATQTVAKLNEMFDPAGAADAAYAKINVIYAPAPSGGDDSAVLNELIVQAANSGGMLVLRAGSYKANLVTPILYQQPLIVGQGRYQTKITAVDETQACVLFNGHQGVIAGGGLRSVGLYPAVNGQGIAVEYRNVCGVESYDVNVQNFAEGVRFHNVGSGGFTEFSTFHGSMLACAIPVHYVVDGGDPSFHGSGLTGNTVITGTWGGPGVLIDSGAFPYNAPMSATFFTATDGLSLMSNRNTGRTANFYGTLRKEGGACWFGEPGQSTIAYCGEVLSMGSNGGDRLGKLFLVDKFYINFTNNNITYQFKPYQLQKTQTAGTVTQITENPGTCLVQFAMVGTNYNYSYLLHCWQSPYDDTGVVTILANPKALDTRGWGAPTFAWAGRGLRVTNTNLTEQVDVYLSVQPMTASIVKDRFGQ